jgi:uncharacterized protein (TIGR02271 family)
MTITTKQLRAIAESGGDVRTTSGDKIGSIGQIYVDESTGEPSWVTVRTGLFGMSESFVPLEGATDNGKDIMVNYDKDTVKDAPRIDADRQLSPDEEETLYAHYGMTSGSGHRDRNRDRDKDRGRDWDRDKKGDTSGTKTAEAMTVSEERLRVGTEKRESGRARLRKYVVTENVTKTVPVSHEEVRVEREPITDANVGTAKSGPDISEEEHEVVLHEERPVVEKDVVPTERVRLTKETSTHDETVSGEVRKEQVDTDVDSSDRKHRQGRGGVEGGDRTAGHGERRDQGQGKPQRR